MKPYRSLLFVPGHKASWVDKALNAGTHAVILDLEDAVPEKEKAEARAVTRDSVARLSETDVGVIVRVNALDTPHFGKDIAAVVQRGLTALLLPKVYSATDISAFDVLLRYFELEAGLPVGEIELIPSLETAKSLTNVDEIAAGPRVGSLMAAAAKGADISREVGFRWSASGEETLYLRSKVVLAARSAGLRHIVLGLWQDIHDLAGLEKFARANAALGYGGQVVIHPSHVAVVNSVFGLDEAEIERLKGIVDAYNLAVSRGQGAATFQGEHIDLAHAENSRQLLAVEAANRKDKR